ncbi:MAG TPA: hypothetical protein VN132_00290 [Bdellovibrio sp.]|nr:hypothetical protein [Bdellovibrio sp.]
MKKLIICSIIGFTSLSAVAKSNCSSEIVEAAKLADGRQSSNCVVTIQAPSVSIGSEGTVEVKCPLAIPFNPTAPTHYLAKIYAFAVASDGCEVNVQPLNQ